MNSSGPTTSARLNDLNSAQDRSAWLDNLRRDRIAGSTSAKDRASSDVSYVNNLIGPNTADTLAGAKLDAFDQRHGRPSGDEDVGAAEAAWVALFAFSATWTPPLNWGCVGVASYAKAFNELIETLLAKVDDLTA